MNAEPIHFSNLNAYRVALAFDQRTAQAWMLATKGSPLRDIGTRFKISRERARQLVARASRVLEEWPDANEWQTTLPLRLRELCVFHCIETAPDLIGVLSGEHVPRGWRPSDVEAARELFDLPPLDDAPLGALERVLVVLKRHADDIETLTTADIPGAHEFAAAAQTMTKHGAAVYRSRRRDDAAIAVSAATATAEPTAEPAQEPPP